MPLPSNRLPISIDELLSMPEGLRVEFKSNWNLGPTGKEVLKTICAFANDYSNVDGGYVVLGVEDDQGTAKLPPTGLDRRRLEEIQKQINGQCRGCIKPNCELTLSHQEVDGRHLLVI